MDIFLKTIKTFAIILSIFLICIGGISLFCNTAKHSSVIKKLSVPESISGVNTIQLDKMGNIYLCNTQNGTVQTFNSGGKFIYGMRYPTDGGDLWMAVSENNLYVYTVRPTVEYMIKDGEVKDQSVVQYAQMSDFYKCHVINKSNKMVKLSAFSKTVTITNDRIMQNIVLDAPNWPFPFGSSIAIFGIGIAILFCCFMGKIGDILDRLND